MNKNDLFGIFYVSVSIFIWGCIGSIIDYPLLKQNIYLQGSLGQAATFSITGIAIASIAIIIFKKFFSQASP